MFDRYVVIASLFVGCGSAQSSHVSDDPSDFQVDVPWEQSSAVDNESEELAYHSVNYQLTWGGKHIGEAREVYRRSDSGVRILRTETLVVERGATKVPIETEVTIDTDLKLRATRVEMDSKAGAVVRRGIATRADDGAWVVAFEGEKVRRESKDAIPAELVPYILKAQGLRRFDSDVLLAGYGFAVVPMRLRQEGDHAKVVLETQWGDIETKMRLDDYGSLVEASAGTVSSTRVDTDAVDPTFDPPEVLNHSAIPLTGTGSVLRLVGYMKPKPPATRGVEIRELAKGWEVRFNGRPTQVPDSVRSINDEVGKLLDESHDAPGAGAKSALELGRGDCSAHAALFVDLAAERGFKAQVVTGFRIESQSLVRHRWAAVMIDDAWIEVDPTFGESPIPSRLHIPLAVHGTSSAEMALVDEAIFRDLSLVTARWVQSTTAMR